jgi:hypothetical protein
LFCVPAGASGDSDGVVAQTFDFHAQRFERIEGRSDVGSWSQPAHRSRAFGDRVQDQSSMTD